jgi:hypothetical protein
MLPSQVLPRPRVGRSAYEQPKHYDFPPSLSPTVATSLAAARPVAARTKLLLAGPVLSTLLRLSAPYVYADDVHHACEGANELLARGRGCVGGALKREATRRGPSVHRQ